MSATTKSIRSLAGTISLLLWVTFVYSESSRPNIVWLISEDKFVHYSTLCFENGAEMPNIDKQDGERGYTLGLDPTKIRIRGYFVARCLVHLCGTPVPPKSREQHPAFVLLTCLSP